ncbi:MAG: Gfo/Idh/MocA family oxidoreductase [Thermomicrobiales bacterium]|nr:Gfo/Idh/MocA family oxidoreductase [Thermomicrobiales bacterium]
MNHRVAVIGLNHYHVTGWVESLAQLRDRVEIVALYDPDPARGRRLAPDHTDPSLSAALPGWAADLPFVTDLDTLIREHRPDVALVTLPNIDAPAAVTRLANAGIHILSDKPLARTAPEAEPAVAAARANGVKLAVALTRRYGRGWQDAAALIANGRLGRLLSSEAIFVTSSVAVRDPHNLIFDGEAMGGGVLHWLGVHDLDLLLWLSGEPVVEVQAMTGTVDTSVAVEDVISMAIRYASGAVGTVHYAYALPRPGGEGYLALRGSEASIRLEPSGTLTVIGPGDVSDPVMTQQTTYESRRLPGYGAVGATIIDDLLRAIDEDRDPLATGENVLGALRLIDAAYESARTGARVRLPSST